MAEYIEREDLLELYRMDDPVLNKNGHVPLPVIRQNIMDIPAADVSPVRHGRWNDGDPYCPICKKDKFRGLDADVWADWKPDYCPNCGAKMDLHNECKQDGER